MNEKFNKNNEKRKTYLNEMTTKQHLFANYIEQNIQILKNIFSVLLHS